MRLPSIDLLRERALAAFLRFPLVLVDASIGTLLVIGKTHEQRAIAACALGLPLLLAIGLFGERRGWERRKTLVWELLGVGLLFLYFAVLPSKLNEGEWIRFLILDVALHLLVAFAPFVGRGRENGFWQFNQRLFIGIATALLYSTTLMIGLDLALVAVDRLFDVRVSPRAYTDVGALIFGVVNTWFFLGIVPLDLEELDRADLYPKGLKIFSQYVLLPLVTIYVFILYLYSAKILLQWKWPNGWVSSLVLGYSVTGILSLLLLHPIRKDEGNRWIGIFSRWFYAALLPLVFLLMLAIWRRISAYGVTEERYIVGVLAYWLAGICAYFLFSRKRSIEVIPVTLCILGLIASYGPWSAHSISVRDQRGRVESMLRRSGLLVDGRFRRAGSALNVKPDTMQEIASVLNYLDSRGALDEIWALGRVATHGDGSYSLLDSLGINLYGTAMAPTPTFAFDIDEPRSMQVAGYDYVVRYEGSSPFPMQGDTFSLRDDHTIYARMDTARNRLLVEIAPDTLAFGLDSLLTILPAGPSEHMDFAKKKGAAALPLVLEQVGIRWKGRVEIDELDADQRGDGRPSVTAVNATVLIGRR